MTTRGGFSMVELVVAIALFGVTAVGLARLATMGGSIGLESTGSTQQSAMLLSEFNRAVAVPAAAMVPGVTCDTVRAAPWWFQRCTRVTNLDSRRQRVAVVVVPVPVNGAIVDPFRPDSLVVERAANVGALDLGGGP